MRVPPDRGRSRARRASRGFTFLGLMFLITLMSILAAVAASTWTFSGQRDKELDLLFAGREYRLAIERYHQAHANSPQPWPPSLQALLEDGDRLAPRRYLRRLYLDPITGTDTWGLVRTPQGGITGVYSLSEKAPIRTRGVWKDDAVNFLAARTYRDWVFSAASSAMAPASAASAPPATQPTAPTQSPDAPPGWNFERDGSPPLKWTTPPPDATDG